MIKDKIPGIYLITNKLNNKKYVGKSKSIYDRWEQHCDSSLKRESNTYIHKAIRKYKPENFKIEIIDDENSNEKELRLGGNKNVITDGATLRKYCTNNTFLSPNGRRTPKEWCGKYTLDLGFKIEYKKEIEND